MEVRLYNGHIVCHYYANEVLSVDIRHTQNRRKGGVNRLFTAQCSILQPYQIPNVPFYGAPFGTGVYLS